MMNEKNNLLIPVSLFSAAIVLAAIIFSISFKSAKTGDQTITVTGSAKKEISSDFGIQRGTLQVTSVERKSAYQSLQLQIPVFLKFLEERGYKKEQIEIFAVNGYPIYEVTSNGMQTQNISNFVYSQRFEIRSNDVLKIKELSVALGALLEKGLDISVDMPEYLFTKIDDIKITVQAEAAKNAMERAIKIAEATGRDLGPLRNARMGVIQITPKNSNIISDYGVNDVSSIDKEITAVVTASFDID
jgi:uncharacterized protein